MKISREEVIKLLVWRRKTNPVMRLPFEIMCKEVDMDNREEDDEDFVGITHEDLDEYEELIGTNDELLPEWRKTFELWFD